MRTPSTDRDAAITSWPPTFILRAIDRGGCPGWGGQWPPSHPPRCGLSVWALLYPPESAPCMSCASA